MNEPVKVAKLFMDKSFYVNGYVLCFYYCNKKELMRRERRGGRDKTGLLKYNFKARTREQQTLDIYIYKNMKEN